MWPYGALGLAILAIYGLSSTPSPAGTGQPTFVFQDYSWRTMLPSTFNFVPGQGTVPGPLPRSIAQTIPPPPGVTQPGRWVEFPGGYACLHGTHNVFAPGTATGAPSGLAVGDDYVADPANPPGSTNNPIFPVYPNVPQGLSMFVWFPGTMTTGRHGQVRIFQVSGYFVASVPSHLLAVTGAAMSAAITSGAGVLPAMPHFGATVDLPPPPGENAHSGKWHGLCPTPGYYVWLTPTNTNNATQAIQAYYDPALAAFLAESGTGGGTPATAPTYSAQGAPAALTQPSYQPTTPYGGANPYPSTPAYGSTAAQGYGTPSASDATPYGGANPYPLTPAG